MGPALPERDVLLSPGARLVVGEDRVPFGTGQAEALVPVVDMTDGRAIRRCRVLGVCYVHVGLDKHEVILANGIWVEAFQPHDQSDSVMKTRSPRCRCFFPVLMPSWLTVTTGIDLLTAALIAGDGVVSYLQRDIVKEINVLFTAFCVMSLIFCLRARVVGARAERVEVRVCRQARMRP